MLHRRRELSLRSGVSLGSRRAPASRAEGIAVIVAAAIALGACGPSLPDDAAHPASARAAAAPTPALARALTEDPAPPPEELSAEARSYASDGDEGVAPPILGIAEHVPGTPRPSRVPGVVGHGDHGDHGGGGGEGGDSGEGGEGHGEHGEHGPHGVER